MGVAFTLVLIWLASIFAMFWLWKDASEKRGGHIGCLWVLIVFALGPIGFIAYLIVRNYD
ncbi:hypothetical protein [Desulfitobacterium sp. AusDCA]|uniref:hypothetical protein n=1 Tax=Desulfitobacterium sp. AusDCA TaxID=3240383 RepID=UPI003DA783B0